jgi:general stress protein 26
MATKEQREKILELWAELIQGSRIGTLTTASKLGEPHSAWMGTIAPRSFDRLITITAPDSRKVINILENPRVEWMFLDSKMARVLYLRGRARPLCDMREVEQAWRDLPDKSRAYFLQRPEQGMSFLPIETTIEQIEYLHPAKAECFSLTPAELIARPKAIRSAAPVRRKRCKTHSEGTR